VLPRAHLEDLINPCVCCRVYHPNDAVSPDLILCDGKAGEDAWRIQCQTCERRTWLHTTWEAAVDAWNKQNPIPKEDETKSEYKEKSEYPEPKAYPGPPMKEDEIKTEYKESWKPEDEPKKCDVSEKKEDSKFTSDGFALNYLKERLATLEGDRALCSSYCQTLSKRGDQQGLAQTQCRMRELDTAIRELATIDFMATYPLV
jgi:hypothetical protein